MDRDVHIIDTVAEFGPFEGYRSTLLEPQPSMSGCSLTFCDVFPGPGWHLDVHTKEGVTPAGLIWVLDCFQNASNEAAMHLGIKNISGYQIKIDGRTAQVYCSGGDESFFLADFGDRSKIYQAVTNFDERWNKFSTSLISQIKCFLETRAMVEILERFRVARRIQYEAWRRHFYWHFALRAHYWSIVKDMFSEGTLEQDLVSILAAERQSSSNFVKCADDDAPSAFECMVNVDPFYGTIWRREVDVNERADIALNSSSFSTRQVELISKLTAANYIWWSSAHHRSIEWIAGLPLYYTLSDFGKLLGINVSDCSFLFYGEIIQAIRAGSLSSELVDLLARRSYAFSSRALPMNGCREVGFKHHVFRGTPVYRGLAEGIPIVFGERVGYCGQTGILVVDDFAPYDQNQFGEIRGCVMESDSMISHAAIAACQLGVPCVGGFGPIMREKIKRASHLRIDGSTGTVEAWY